MALPRIPLCFEPCMSKILCKIYNIVMAKQTTIRCHHFTIKQDVSMAFHLRGIKDWSMAFEAIFWVTLRQALSHYKHEASCIYVNNVGPWNAIKYLPITVLIDSTLKCEINLHNGTLTCSERNSLSGYCKVRSRLPDIVLYNAQSSLRGFSRKDALHVPLTSAC